MGNVYCALNHDRKEAYQLGKSFSVIEMLGEWAHQPDFPFEYFKFKELNLFDMVKHLAAAWPDTRIDHVEKVCRELLEFKAQSIYEECDDAVLEYYRDYKYSGSIYDEPEGFIGSPIHDRDEDHVTDGDLRPQDAPHLKTPLVGKLGILQGTAIHFGNPQFESFVEKRFCLQPGEITVILSDAPSRVLGAQWKLDEPITFKFDFSCYRKGRTYVSKRLRKIRAKRMKFTCEETKGGSIQRWIDSWHKNVIGDLQQQIKENDVKLNEQAEQIANLLQGK